jgi:hypothetical protein
MQREELVTQLRAWSRRFGPRSMERRLMRSAADRIEDDGTRELDEAEAPKLTPEAVEKAMGGRSLFPWQRKALMGGYDE